MRRDFPMEIGAHRRASISKPKRWQLVIGFIGSAASALVVLGSSGRAASPSLEQQVAPANVDVETITLPSGSASVEAYLAKPKGEGKRRAVLIVHDSLGLDDRTREVARRFAGADFVAVAPDLLSRVGGTGKKTPEEIMRALGQTVRDESGEDTARALGRITPAQTVADVKAAFAFLEKAANVDGSKISAVGFGWGTWRTFMLAEGAPNLHKAVVFYGSTPDDGLEAISAPVLAHYAQFDFIVTGNAVWTRQQLGKKFTYYIYPTARGFFNETDRQYHATSANLAWTRTLEFLGF